MSIVKPCAGTTLATDNEELECEQFEYTDCILHKDALVELGLPENSTTRDVINAILNSLINLSSQIGEESDSGVSIEEDNSVVANEIFKINFLGDIEVGEDVLDDKKVNITITHPDYELSFVEGTLSLSKNGTTVSSESIDIPNPNYTITFSNNTLRLLKDNVEIDSVAINVTGFEASLGNPTTDGQVLSSTASGTREWVDLPTSQSDNLGDHTATQILNMNNNGIIGVLGITNNGGGGSLGSSTARWGHVYSDFFDLYTAANTRWQLKGSGSHMGFEYENSPLAYTLNSSGTPSRSTDLITKEFFDNNSATGASSPLTTKGDLYGFSTLGERLPVGIDGQVLTADSSSALGLSWGTPPTGMDYSVPVDENLIPADTNRNIGSNSQRFDTGWFNDVFSNRAVSASEFWITPTTVEPANLADGIIYFNDNTKQFLGRVNGSFIDLGGTSGTGDMLSVNNLSDVADAPTALVNLGLTATATELNYVDGVTSSVQTQLDSKIKKGSNNLDGFFRLSNTTATEGAEIQIFNSNDSQITLRAIVSGADDINFIVSRNQGVTANGFTNDMIVNPEHLITKGYADANYGGPGGTTVDNQNKINNSILYPKTLDKNDDYILTLGDSYNNIPADSDIGRKYIMEVNDGGTTVATIPDVGGKDDIWVFRTDEADDTFEIIPEGSVLDWNGRTTENAVRLTGIKGGLIYMRKKSPSNYFLDGDITGFSYSTNLMLTGTEGGAGTTGGLTNSSTSPNYVITDDGTSTNLFDRYTVIIPLASNGLAVGDVVQIAMDSVSGGTSPRIQVNIDNVANSEIATIQSGTLSDTGTIPSGATELTIWILANYNSSSNNTATFTNVVLTKL